MKKAFLFSVFLVLFVSHGFLTAQDAPDFRIYNYDTQTEWQLSDYVGTYVICLISGSFC